MTPDELLKPRYKVIADYPDNILPVGSIFWDDCESIEIISPSGAYSVQSSYPYRNKDKYPHLFRPLEWYEERKAEDMPQYVIFHQPYAHFVKGEIHNLIQLSTGQTSSFVWLRAQNPSEYLIPLSALLPTTEEEYNKYIQSCNSQNEK